MYYLNMVWAVMAHDDRDYDFAMQYGLNIIEVIKGGSEGAYTGDGIHHHSGIIDGLYNDEAIEKNN